MLRPDVVVDSDICCWWLVVISESRLPSIFPVGSLHAQARCRQCSLSQEVNALLALVRARANEDADAEQIKSK
jgi:hypothetical protein